MAIITLTLSLTIGAQTPEQIEQLAKMLPQLQMDPAVRKGVLPNGMTYYIRHNAWPENRAYFYIAQNTGSMQEEDNQRGLAHFLEHMCFNGTTHFPDNKMIKYLESIGVKFGENLNAYTSFDEIVYNIDNVKTDRESALDSCLLILHDWSCDLTLDDKEIDKERGVINEEWRLRRSASLRMAEAALPDLYAGSKYAQRMPIGTMDIVMNFPHKDLRDYYHRWFRTDLQAIVVVGDIDPDKMEAKIKNIFGPIKAVKDAPKREFYPVPDNAEPIVSIQTDKEQMASVIFLMLKHDAFPEVLKNTPMYYMQHLTNQAISTMFSKRIDEILQKENPPFIAADMEDGNYFISKTKGALTGQVVFKENEQAKGLATLYREMLRAARNGFTVTEYERFKQDYLTNLEDIYSKRDKTYSSNYVQECVQNYLNQEPMPGIEWEHQNLKLMIEQMPLEVINKQVRELIPENDSNLVVLMYAPEKEGVTLPTKEDLINILHQVRTENIEAYKEEVNNDPLVEAKKLKGSKVKSIKSGDFDSQVLTLKNGIRIHVKKTDFTPNSISMHAISHGGTSLYDAKDFDNADNCDLTNVGGLGNFSATELQKKLSGKKVSASASVSARTEDVTGSCVTKDLETLLQLTYLNFTSPRRDDAAYNSTITRVKENLKNADLDPTTALTDTINKVFYNNNPRKLRLKADDVDTKLNYDRILAIYKERFANAADFDFYFVGDIDLATAQPLFEKYLGSLPVSKKMEKEQDIDMRLTKGKVVNVFEKEQQTPNAISIFCCSAPMEKTLKNVIATDILEQVMQTLYLNTVREDQGGAYTVGVSCGVQEWPEAIANFVVQLPTAPEKRAKMTELIYKGMEDMCKEGPAAEELQKTKEYLHRSHAENLKKNAYWMNQLINKSFYGHDYVDGYDAMVDSITAEDIKAVANTIFHSGNCLEVGMTSPLAK